MKLQIRKIMQERGVNGVQLAARLGVSKQRVANICRGDAGVQIIDRIAAALDVPAWQLIEGAPLGDVSAPDGAHEAGAPTCPHCGKPLRVRIE